MIPFAEFQKLDLRVAKVLSVENHPNADKLYVLKIDLGGTERQIVAGMRPYYTPEQLVGSTIVVVANLEPALLRGVESQGMLLAAQDGPKVLVLRPDGEAAPGFQSIVKRHGGIPFWLSLCHYAAVMRPTETLFLRTIKFASDYA